jgi:FtsP/CotA-like multicopper oxidase with cupredoxin domain
MAVRFGKRWASSSIYRFGSQICAILIPCRCIRTAPDVVRVSAFVVAFPITLVTQPVRAEDSGDSWRDPPLCSRLPHQSISPELIKYNICEITQHVCNKVPADLARKCHNIKVYLTANRGEFKNTGEIEIGGYKVNNAEHYNDSYLTPVIEALPGDTVAAHIVNDLPDRKTDCMMDGNPTNLHYFHGGIVSPSNGLPEVVDARQGAGDNIYVYLKNGADSNSFDLKVPIPGDGELDARVLEGEGKDLNGKISHPVGLNWYHSHLHCLSSDQVLGGMSGLLSVGEQMANVKGKCPEGTPADQCHLTGEFKERTIVKYAMLRDVTLSNINALPTDSTEPKTADWDPKQERIIYKGKCLAPGEQKDHPKPELRKGFCQRDPEGDPKSLWLFTLNGQRFPTITIERGKNLLLRLGNLSSNVAYWLELKKVKVSAEGSTEELEPEPVKLNILSLDGVVPARPQTPEGEKPVDAVRTDNLLLMPASRVEIYIRNDGNDEKEDKEWNYVLRTRGLDTGDDKWPEIRLAHIRLKATPPAATKTQLALNVPVERIEPLSTMEMIGNALQTTKEKFVNALQTMPSFLTKPFLPKGPPHTEGCVRELRSQEHRRVTFRPAKENIKAARFGVKTEIVQEPDQDQLSDYYGENGDFSVKFKVDSDATVDASFEEYELEDGKIDWDGTKKLKHVCVRLTTAKKHYQQLWVLHNNTSFLHNFHIHQMKFRLAKKEDLEFHHINTKNLKSSTCESKPGAPESNPPCNGPDYQLWDVNPDPKLEWHDTIPVPPTSEGDVFLIMSFVDEMQRGRFVYHCHILKHEDKGLMAPIEVWGP